MDIKEIYKKIKVMRVLKGWSQDQAAEKLGMALSSYAKIERGETDVNISRLAQIAETMEVDLSQLLELNGGNAINVIENCNNYGKMQKNSIYLTETQCAHELEKAQLIQCALEKENENLKKQIEQLEEINRLLKGEKSP